MIEVTTTSRLVSVTEFKDYIALEVDTYDTLIGRLIDTITAEMEKYCQRILRTSTITETFLHPDESLRKEEFIELQEFPVTSVTSITTILDGVSTVMDSSNYTIEKNTGRIYLTDTSAWVMADSVVVVYGSGWATVPPDITDVVYQLVHGRFSSVRSGETPSAMRGPVKFERIDGAISMSYDTSGLAGTASDGMNPVLGNFSSTLDYYRSDRVWGQ